MGWTHTGWSNVAELQSKRLGELLEERARDAKPPKERVGPAGAYFPDPDDILKVPETIEAVKQADALADRLKLDGR